MHLIASHQGRPSNDPIFSLHEEASQRKKDGEAIVDATIGVRLDDDGHLSILPSASRAVRDVAEVEWAEYAPIVGTAQFRGAVIDDLLARAPALRRTAVAVATPGASGALRHAVANFLEPGHAALTTSWFWAPYETICREADRRLETFEMFGKDGGLDVDALDAGIAKQLASQGRCLVIVNDPAHNPSGYSMSDADWRGVVQCVGSRGSQAPVTLAIDCAYLHYGPRAPHDVVAALEPLAGRSPVLFTWSASKSYTHYGLRVGALVACIPDDRERERVANALSYSSRGTWSNCNRGGLTAITRCLTDAALASSCHAEREILKSSLRARVDAFNGYAGGLGLHYPRYDGGFFVTIFHERALEKAAAMRAAGVYVVPQLLKDGSGALRVALCAVPVRDVRRLVEALAS
jgi:aromatic-amino-acid transaminase